MTDAFSTMEPNLPRSDSPTESALATPDSFPVADPDFRTDSSPLADSGPPLEMNRVLSMPVEAVMDSHRLRGELHMGGVPRRLVDILNSFDGGFLIINKCRLDDPLKSDNPRSLETIQVSRDAILFIMPRGETCPSDPFEVVRKVSAPATVVVPGFEISGNIYLMPHVDPSSVPLIGTRHFIPVTEATVTSGYGRSEVWREPIVLVNLARTLAYGPNS